jgi:ApbE superfamily uncharacterized protein (UPF0280 family)
MHNAQNTVTKAIISPVSRTAGHTQVGYIDTMGADYVKLDVNVSDIATVGTASATGGSISIGEADDTNVSNATTIVADRTALKYARNVTYLVDTKSKKRYVHVTFTAGTAGVSNETQLVSVVGATSRLEQSPTSTGGMVSGLTNSVAVIVT